MVDGEIVMIAMRFVPNIEASERGGGEEEQEGGEVRRRRGVGGR